MNLKWKKMISIALTCGLVIGSVPQPAFAYETPETVRVGLESVCKNVTTATIGGTELLFVTEYQGKFLDSGSISSSGGFQAQLMTGEFVALDETMSQKEAVDFVDTFARLGYTAYATCVGSDGWTVYVIGASLSDVEAESRESATKIRDFSGVLIKGGRESVLLPKDAKVLISGTENGDTFSVNGKRYRGLLSFAINSTVMTAVNTIDLEQYLYGVVPSEMPQSYEAEALKAQAVAARTYAMTKLAAHTASGYQLCDTTNCQVYKGYSGEAVPTTKAIDQTEGHVATYAGKPIQAVFSASTGGYTENSENVWNDPFPYLKAVPEIGEDGDNTWKATVTLKELDDLLIAKNENIGRAEDIVITKLSTGGRIQEMQIIGSQGTKTLTKENIRTYFSGAPCGSLPGKMFTINGKGGDIGVYGQSATSSTSNSTTTVSKGGSLAAAAANKGIVAKTEGELSSINGKAITVKADGTNGGTKAPANSGAYEVYSVSISTINNNDEFVFEGVGKGHGVGFSQKGAQSMAKLGYDYEEILKYYYTGIAIEG